MARRWNGWVVRITVAGHLVAPLCGFMAAAQTQQELPDGPGKDTVKRVCSACHGVEIVMGKGLTEDGWTAIVVNMAGRGAQATDEEFGEIVQYLAKNFPPQSDAVEKVNVNKASADDMKAALSLSAKQADSVVAYREKNGNFKTLDDLKKVPGLDAAKVDSIQDRISF